MLRKISTMLHNLFEQEQIFFTEGSSYVILQRDYARFDGLIASELRPLLSQKLVVQIKLNSMGNNQHRNRIQIKGNNFEVCHSNRIPISYWNLLFD